MYDVGYMIYFEKAHRTSDIISSTYRKRCLSNPKEEEETPPERAGLK